MGASSAVKSESPLTPIILRKLLEQTAAEKGISPEQYLELLECSLSIATATATLPATNRSLDAGVEAVLKAAAASSVNEGSGGCDSNNSSSGASGGNRRAVAAQVQTLLHSGVKATRLNEQLAWASQLLHTVTFVTICTITRHYITARMGGSLTNISVILPNHEQLPTPQESYQVGQTLAVYIVATRRAGASSVSLIASRTSPGLVRELVAEHLLVGLNTAFSIEQVRRQPGEKSEIILTRCAQHQHQPNRSAATKAKPVSFSWETEKLKYVQELLPAGEQLEFREGAARPRE